MWCARAVAQLFSLPLLVHEGVRELVCLLTAHGAATREHRHHRNSAADDASQHARLVGPSSAREHADSDAERGRLSPDEQSAVGAQAEAEMARRERRGGVLWCVAATAVALCASDTSQVLALVAALCGAPLMNVLPPLMALCSRGRGASAMGASGASGARGVVLDASLLALGVGVSVASAAVALASAMGSTMGGPTSAVG